jgi:hypothetical protein
MATATYVPLATQTLGSAASSIVFSSIPSGYTDLRLVFTGTTSTNANVFLQFNGDTSTNYSATYLYGQDSTTSSASDQSVGQMPLGGQTVVTPTIPALIITDVFSYTSSVYKSALITSSTDKNGGANSTIQATVGLWRSTSAITSINTFVTGRNFNAGTTITLWGI